jgi:hypothetical protein
MIKYDNKEIEEKICNLFVDSISVKHYKYRNNESKINFFTETFLYLHFYRNIKNSSDLILNKKLNYILRKKFKIKNSSDITMLKKILKDLITNSLDITQNISKHNQKKYKDLEKYIIRKLKIKMVLNQNNLEKNY